MSNNRILSPQVTNIATSSGRTKAQAGLTEIWDDLKLGIESVYQQQTMDKTRYMILYS